MLIKLLSILFLVQIFQSFSQSTYIDSTTDSLGVIFDFDSSILREVDEQFFLKELEMIFLRSNKIQSISLVGYTDTTGNIYYNSRLCSNRISTIYNLLLSKIDNSKIDTLNMNENRSYLLDNDTVFRRVDVFVKTIKLDLGIPYNLNINFISGTDQVYGENSFENIELISNILLTDKEIKIDLLGHVCCNAPKELSLQRAEKIKFFLIERGIDTHRIHCEGYGFSKRLVEERSEVDKAMNRRVEAVFYK